MNVDIRKTASHRRRTKIIATLGPGTDDPAVMEGLIRAGVDVFRVNMSHGDEQEHERRATLVRQSARKLKWQVALLVDLQGPKIRVEKFADGEVELVDGAHFTLDTEDVDTPGDRHRVGVSYKGLTADVTPGDILLLDDGLISIQVQSIEAGRVHCLVQQGGILRNRKGLNLQGGGLSISGLAEHDLPHIKLAARLGADYVAVSFVSCAEDLNRARALLRDAGSEAALIAKIERMEAINNLEEICDATDAVMVARGDLGVEIGDEELPGLQKRIIRTAIKHNRIVATATQMMQSMIENPVPTRAEVLDVANAVLDGTDAVMLSAETAVGKHPVKVIESMNRICLGAERHFEAEGDIMQLNVRFQRIDQAIASAAMYMATHVAVKAIIALTESGSTAQWLSRVQTAVPIYAFSTNAGSRRRMAMFRDVFPVKQDSSSDDADEVIAEALRTLLAHGAVADNDRVIVTMGDEMCESGGTNTLRYIKLDIDGRARYGV
ncbi:MAG: pyruvate kinase [Xanthomonadales bacterium]|nr:pyruvate kinase [Gammaproteobacteria bacterium]NND58362.1 pyruvate kinase [Xanthomonadales bacterium]NNK51743.1 pyruvate kinase [Xanthomonadales bacterium]